MRVMLREVAKRFGREPVLEQISLTFEPSTRWGLVGPSGAGKTTLLRIIAGLERPNHGEVIWETEDRVTRPRGIGFVFQELGLWPHVTARDHVEYVLAGLAASRRRQRAAELLEEVQLPSAAWLRRPGELSGGEAQRVAIARALAIQPTLFVLDEPFVQLHPELRAELGELVDHVVRRRQATLICVSHAWRDLQQWCDHVAVLVQGKVVQTGSCDQVFRQPCSAEVARLTGPYLSIPARWLARGQVTPCGIMDPPEPNFLATDHACPSNPQALAEVRNQASALSMDQPVIWSPARTADGTLLIRPQQIVIQQPASPNRWKVQSCQLLGEVWSLELAGETVGETVDNAQPIWKIPVSYPLRPGTLIGVGILWSSRNVADL